MGDLFKPQSIAGISADNMKVGWPPPRPPRPASSLPAASRSPPSSTEYVPPAESPLHRLPPSRCAHQACLPGSCLPALFHIFSVRDVEAPRGEGMLSSAALASMTPAVLGGGLGTSGAAV